MRKLIVFMVLSLDGFVCGENGELDWETRDDAVGRYLVPPVQERVDTMLLGRVLYKGFEQAWPAMAKNHDLPPDLIEFAHWIEDTPKVFFTSTITEAPWANSRIVSVSGDDDIAAEVTRLKQFPGKDLLVFGGARFAQTLTKLGLVNEFIFKIQPIALGKGKSLFGGLPERQNLKLVSSKAFDSGVITTTYMPTGTDEN